MKSDLIIITEQKKYFFFFFFEILPIRGTDTHPREVTPVWNDLPAVIGAILHEKNLLQLGSNSFLKNSP